MPMHAPLRANTIPETELGELRFDTRSPSSSDGNELMPIGAQDCSTERRAGMTRETRGIAPVWGHDSEWWAPRVLSVTRGRANFTRSWRMRDCGLATSLSVPSSQAGLVWQHFGNRIELTARTSADSAGRGTDLTYPDGDQPTCWLMGLASQRRGRGFKSHHLHQNRRSTMVPSRPERQPSCDRLAL